MVLAGPGTFNFVLSSDLTFEEWACVSSPGPAIVEVYLNGVLIERVNVAAGTPHTWWSTNALLKPRQVAIGDKVSIVITGPASMRIEWPLAATP